MTTCDYPENTNRIPYTQAFIVIESVNKT